MRRSPQRPSRPPGRRASCMRSPVPPPARSRGSWSGAPRAFRAWAPRLLAGTRRCRRWPLRGALRLLRGLRRPCAVQVDRLANESLEGGRIDLLALGDVDRATDVAVET